MNSNNNKTKRHTEEIKNGTQNRKKEKSENKNLWIALIIAVIAASAVFAYNKLFVISSFIIEGNAEYTAEQAEAAANSIGLEKGMKMFAFSKKEASENARYYLAEFDDVSISYKLPSKIVFKVKEARPAMYIYEGGRHYILSEALKVISAHDDAQEAENKALMHVYIGGVTKCRTGMFLETDTGCDEILKELNKVLEEENVITDVSEIDVRNKFAVTFEYKKRFTVKLGSADNFTVKVKFMKSIAEKLAETDSGYIDVSDEDFREGFFKPYG